MFVLKNPAGLAMAQVTPVTKHPNEDDVRDFAIACQIDPLFDDKYMPMINSAVHSAMPEGWKIKIGKSVLRGGHGAGKGRVRHY